MVDTSTTTALGLATTAEDSPSLNLEDVLAQARRNSLTRDNPLLADLPAWVKEFRDHQRVAVREILCAYEEGAECVVLDAPTGSGKTLVGETVRRLLSMQTTSYICSSKALQEQFKNDYPYAKVLKGRSNYATESYPERFGGKDGLSCADCTKSPGASDSCMWCDSTANCPYEQAKVSALRSELAVLNTSYFLSECNGPGWFSRGGLVIADEADCLESELMSHVEVRVSERRLKQYGLGVPRYVTKEESWREWAEEAYEKVKSNPPQLRGGTDNITAIREAKRHTILVQKLRGLRDGLEDGGWVYVGTRDAAAFKPITVDRLGQEKFWQHGDKFLLMSATVISADELLESLGWDDEREWRLVKVPSTFDPANRRVVVWPAADMTYKKKDTEYPKMVAGVKEVLAKHPEDRVLVHSTSYELTRALEGGLTELGATAPPQNPDDAPRVRQHSRTNSVDNLDDPIRPTFTYADSAGKDQTLTAWLESPNGILIAPSFDRGIDLPGDSCRVQIICKVPYGNLRDKQISARRYTKGGSVWYNVQAIRTVIQMCGRAVRGEEDWAVTYILDGQFVSNLWASSRRLFPEWWKEGLEWRVKGL